VKVQAVLELKVLLLKMKSWMTLSPLYWNWDQYTRPRSTALKWRIPVVDLLKELALQKQTLSHRRDETQQFAAIFLVGLEAVRVSMIP
jgi:hypothetical protein